jgi:hypothetical protein
VLVACDALSLFQPNIILENTADLSPLGIELADTMSAQFQKSEGDGLLGLAMGKLNTVQPVQQKTPVENMISYIIRLHEFHTALTSSLQAEGHSGERRTLHRLPWVLARYGQR